MQGILICEFWFANWNLIELLGGGQSIFLLYQMYHEIQVSLKTESLCKSKRVLSEGVVQRPSAEAVQRRLLRSPSRDEHARGIFALPKSLPKCNQFIQSSNVIFLWTSMSCPSELLSETLQSSSEQDSFQLCDMALKCSFPHYLRRSAQWGNPCRALLYLYVDEPGCKFPKSLYILLNLPEESGLLLCFKVLL